MKKIILVPLTICLILVILLGISALTLADIESETNKKAEQRFERANELLRRADYEAAIAEYKKVLNISSNSKIAQDAQYWIGQSHFRAGQFDAAQATFAKLIEEYPASAITPATKLMVERIKQAKEKEAKRKAMENTADKGFIIDPETGVTYTRIVNLAGKSDIIEYVNDCDLSPNSKFIVYQNLVIPSDGSEPFEFVDESVTRCIWSPDGKKVAFYSKDGICTVPISSQTGRVTGSVKKLVDGDYRYHPRASWSPDGEKLAFTRHDKKNSGDIWCVSTRDGLLTQITSDPDGEYAPTWSPDGKMIAYYKKENRDIWLCSAEGGNPRKIVDPGSGFRWGPYWAPDGKWILYMGWEGSPLFFFHLTDRRTLSIATPKVVGGFFPRTCGGNKMLFYRTSYGYREGLNIVSAFGGPPLDLAGKIPFYGSLAWSPDSRMVAIGGANEDGEIVLWILPLSGVDPIPLKMDVSVDGKPFPFAVSPNAEKLAFLVDRDDGTEDLYAVPISMQTARTTGPAVKVFDRWYREGGFNVRASWSPDGSKLLVIHRQDVWIASSNGDQPIQVTQTMEMERCPGWSPDGRMINYIAGSKRIFYVRPASGGKATKIVGADRTSAWSPDSKKLTIQSDGMISFVSVADGGTQQIAKLKDLGLDRVFDLSWSPDGKFIAFVGNHIEKGNAGPIFIIPAEGGKATMLVTDDNSRKHSLSWSPDSRWITYGSQGPVKVRPETTMWVADFEEIVKKASR